MTFSSTSYQPVDGDPSDAVTVPGLIPELTYHIGVTEDVEFGGRVALGFGYGELDLKYRFHDSDGLHLAVAPALGQAAIAATSPGVTWARALRMLG